jgi:hypothetical protein
MRFAGFTQFSQTKFSYNAKTLTLLITEVMRYVLRCKEKRRAKPVWAIEFGDYTESSR